MLDGPIDRRATLGPLIAVVVIAGVAIGLTSELSWPTAASSAVALASVAVLSFESRRARTAIALVALAAAGVCHGVFARARAVAPPLVVLFDQLTAGGDQAPGTTALRGHLVLDAAATAFGVRLVIDVRDVRNDGVWIRAPARVQAYVAGELAAARVKEWTAGRPIEAPVALRRPQALVNPGSLDPVQQALRRPFHLAGTIKSAALVVVDRGAWWDESAAAIRRSVRDAVGRSGLGDPHAAIVTAILIGDRAGVSDDVERRLQAAGTYHVIAISGGNVALVIVMTQLVVRLAIRRHRGAIIVTLLFVLGYGFIVGDDPSVQRAVTAAVVYLTARLVGLVPRAVHVIAVVALLAVVLEPGTAVDVGAWLSFGATLGIVLYARDFAGWFSRLAPWIPRWCFTLLGATLAAELALVPVSASVFSRVGAAGLFLNFVAIPAMAVVQLAGLLVVIFDAWWTGASSVAARVAGIAAGWLVDSTMVVEWLPWLSWRVPPPEPYSIVAHYAGWAIALRAGAHPIVRRGAVAVAVVGSFAVMTATGVEAAALRNRLRVTMLDVGQGDAVVVQFPDGQSLLVDTGGTPGPFDIGGRVVTPALWALGIRQLDWLAITHADLDHIGGAEAVLADLSPREVWEAVPVPRNPDLRALRVSASERRTAWRTLQRGDRLAIGDVVIEVVHPPLPEWERQKVRNDDSLVLKLVYGHVEFLLTGDAGKEFEGSQRLEAESLLRILKVGHHGSRTSTSEQLVAKIRPHIALVSAGRSNLFGHPAPDVMARLDRAGTTVFRTDRDAAIILETDGTRVSVSSLSGRTFDLRSTHRK